MPLPNPPISRRHALIAGAALAGGLGLAARPARPGRPRDSRPCSRPGSG